MTDELRAYTPTWRDRVAAALIGEGKPSAYYRNVVSGPVGSAGIGATGFSLSDLTPAGAVFSADEMVRNARDGNCGLQQAKPAGTVRPWIHCLPAASTCQRQKSTVSRGAASVRTSLSGPMGDGCQSANENNVGRKAVVFVFGCSMEE
nr:hypothetical protein [Mesorhizobium loti]